MARKEVTQFFDDLDGTALTSDDVVVTEFSYKGTEYVLDLSDANAQKFAEVLEPYIAVSTKVGKAGGRPRGRAAASGPKSDPNRNRRIREWARSQGREVSTRGQISHDVIEAYEAANPADR
ncbi:MAG: histone-like nucleoid-structuring protein Lsr2 [Mycobacteriaceae bacterium]|uniref:histone-like nucleoid-structuring protein Lsr2 n=1 Tax=Corynebacterium sp. TaxID=1720 RepID=UPI003F97D8A4